MSAQVIFVHSKMASLENIDRLIDSLYDEASEMFGIAPPAARRQLRDLLRRPMLLA
jgi:hypothetical protein